MNLKLRLFLAAGFLTLCLVHSAMGHGIPLKVFADGTNRLYAPTLVAYDPAESHMTPNALNIKGAGGFYPDLATFPAGRSLTVDASGSGMHSAVLMYWDGSNLLPSPVSIQLQRTGILATVSPTDTFVHIGTLPAFSGLPGGHSALNILLPLGSPTGLYAVGFQATSPGSPDFARSETFWGVANYGLTSPEQIELGLAAIQSAVPEPSSLALLAMAACPLAWLRWRRRAAST
jgi:hypothetical protein